MGKPCRGKPFVLFQTEYKELSMPTHEEFRNAITEDPDNDTPRLIYADWLDELGDPRGEFIRIQCELAKNNDEFKMKELATKADDLLREHEIEWTCPILGITPKIYNELDVKLIFYRGFAELPFFIPPKIEPKIQKFEMVEQEFSTNLIKELLKNRFSGSWKGILIKVPGGLYSGDIHSIRKNFLKIHNWHPADVDHLVRFTEKYDLKKLLALAGENNLSETATLAANSLTRDEYSSVRCFQYHTSKQNAQSYRLVEINILWWLECTCYYLLVQESK